MLVLVTGASGYVGSRLVAYLRQAPDISVRAMVRRPTSWVHADEQVRADLLEAPSTLGPACRGVDAVVHLAGINESLAARDVDHALMTTILGTRRLVDAAVREGVRRLVYVSTAHVYGASAVEGAVVSEETIPRPRHPYAIAGLASEHLLTSGAGMAIETVIFRMTNSLGPPVHPAVARWTLVTNELCREAALTGRVTLRSPGCQWRDFIAQRDVCRILKEAVLPDRIPPGTYNLASGRSITIRQLAALVQDAFERLTCRRPPLHAPDAPTTTPKPHHFSVERLGALGFRAIVPVHEAVRDTAAFCLQHAEQLASDRGRLDAWGR